MKTVKASAQRSVVHFRRGEHRFGVRRNENARSGYIGFCDGQQSVAATERHIVVRLLLQHHSPSQARRMTKA